MFWATVLSQKVYVSLYLQPLLRSAPEGYHIR